MGGKESAGDGALHESDGAELSLDVRKPRRRCGVSFQRDEAKAGPRAQRLGVLTQNRYWPPDGDVTLEGMKNNIRFYAEQTGAKGPLSDPGKYVDQSFCARR